MIMTRAALNESEDKRAEMAAYLERVAQPMRDQGLTVRTEVLTGDPPEAIIGYLKSNPAQLLAMATRGRTGLSRMVVGSDTENMIHLVKKTPLLLVGMAD
jgi:nucleotide-binding universal stress UspA family protein